MTMPHPKPWHDQNLAKLLLRLGVGGLMLPHGVAKLQHGFDGIQGMLAVKGLPEALAYGVVLGEVVAPLLVIVGLFTRPAAALIAFTMATALWLAHGDELFTFNQFGALTVELPLLFLLGALALFFSDAGAYSLRRGRGRWD